MYVCKNRSKHRHTFSTYIHITLTTYINIFVHTDYIRYTLMQKFDSIKNKYQAWSSQVKPMFFVWTDMDKLREVDVY